VVVEEPDGFGTVVGVDAIDGVRGKEVDLEVGAAASGGVSERHDGSD